MKKEEMEGWKDGIDELSVKIKMNIEQGMTNDGRMEYWEIKDKRGKIKEEEWQNGE
jgi:hypothetical protein